MTELAFVLLFTAAGVGAALLALRTAAGSPLIRWLVGGYCLLALANLALHVWRIVADDPGGSGQVAAVIAMLAIAVFGYRRLLRAIRRRAGRHGAGPNGP